MGNSGGAVADHIIGETPREAAQRELWEELRLVVSIGDEAGKYEFSEDGNNFSYTSYNAVIVAGEPQIKEDKHDGFAWLSWDRLNRIRNQLSANLRNVLDARLAGQLNLSS